MFNAPVKEDNTTTLKDGVYNMEKNINEAAHDAGRKARSMMHTANNELSHVREYLGTEIRGNPVRSSVIALGVGMFLGALFRR